MRHQLCTDDDIFTHADYLVAIDNPSFVDSQPNNRVLRVGRGNGDGITIAEIRSLAKYEAIT